MSITSTNVITTSSISLSEIERYIALTTRWVYASDCSSRWRTYISRYQNGPPATQSVYNVLNPFSSESIASDTSFRTCLPYAQSYTSQYSPGVCPEGSRLAMVTEYHVQNAMGQSSTDYAGPCCGSGMTYDPSAAQCTATFTRPLQVLLPVTSTTTTLSTPNGTPTTVTDFTASWTGTLRGSGTASDSLYFNYTTLASGVKVEDPIFVGWALRDLDVFPTDYASSLAQTIGIEWTAAPGGSPTGGLPRPTSNGEPGDEGTGSWTTGAKVGIGLGISLGALVVLGLLVFCILRRRMVRIRQAEDEYQRDMQAGARGMPELADQDQELKSRKWFLGGKWRSEVGAGGGGEGKSGVIGGHAGNGNRADYEIDSRPVHVVPGPPVEMDAAQMYYGGGR